MRYNYPAIFKQDKKNTYLVSFPDLEGCYTDGVTLVKALDNARDVLNLMLWDMEEQGTKIPQPTLPIKLKLTANLLLRLYKQTLWNIENYMIKKQSKRHYLYHAGWILLLKKKMSISLMFYKML